MNYSIVKKHSSTIASAKPSGSIPHYLGSINYCTSTVATFHYAVMLYKCWPAPGIILSFHSFSPSITDLSLFEVVLDDSIWHCYVKSRLIPFFFYPFKSIQPWMITTEFLKSLLFYCHAKQDTRVWLVLETSTWPPQFGCMIYPTLRRSMSGNGCDLYKVCYLRGSLK